MFWYFYIKHDDCCDELNIDADVQRERQWFTKDVESWKEFAVTSDSSDSEQETDGDTTDSNTIEMGDLRSNKASINAHTSHCDVNEST